MNRPDRSQPCDAPGIVRGFDQLYAWTAQGWRFALVSADAAVPNRTSALVVEHYDEEGVLGARASTGITSGSSST